MIIQEKQQNIGRIVSHDIELRKQVIRFSITNLNKKIFLRKIVDLFILQTLLNILNLLPKN